MSDNQLSVDPHQLHSAAAKLDALAERLDKTLTAQTPGLKVPSSGTDEVSVRAAASFNKVADEFGADSDNAVLELRKIAAVLRLQANTFGHAEDSNMQTFLS